MSNIVITAVATAVLAMFTTAMILRVELRMDCENLGQFRLNEVVYTCTPQTHKAPQEVDDD